MNGRTGLVGLAVVCAVLAGTPAGAITDRYRVHFKRKNAVIRALHRLHPAQVYSLLDRLRFIDGSVRGLNKADPWLELENFFLLLAGSGLSLARKVS